MSEYNGPAPGAAYADGCRVQWAYGGDIFRGVVRWWLSRDSYIIDEVQKLNYISRDEWTWSDPVKIVPDEQST